MLHSVSINVLRGEKRGESLHLVIQSVGAYSDNPERLIDSGRHALVKELLPLKRPL